MTEQKMEVPQQSNQPQPQPVQQPVQQPVAQVYIPATIPAIQNTTTYLAIGPQGQLYSYDLNLATWGMASGKDLEKIMVASGIPPQTLEAVRRVVGTPNIGR